MTSEEKEKLFTAIGYSGSSHNLALPKQVSAPASGVPDSALLRSSLRRPPSAQSVLQLVLCVCVCIQYVAVVVTFQLFRTSVTVREQLDVPELLRVQMIDLSTRICQRPGAQAFR